MLLEQPRPTVQVITNTFCRLRQRNLNRHQFVNRHSTIFRDWTTSEVCLIKPDLTTSSSEVAWRWLNRSLH